MKKNLLILSVILLSGIAAAAVFWYRGTSQNKHIASYQFKHQKTFKDIDGKRQDDQRYVYVCLPYASLYTDSSGSKADSFLNAGDSVLCINGWSSLFESKSLYPIEINIKGKLKEAWIKGSNLGRGISVDIDHDGQNELVAAHYTNYKWNSEDDVADGDAEAVIIKNWKILAKAPFKANDEIFLTPEDSNRSYPNCTFVKIWNGVEGCDYINTERLMVYDGRRIYFLFDNMQLYSAGEFGNYYDYIFPKSKNGHKDRILSIWHHVEYEHDTIETIHSLDTAIYGLKDGMFKQLKDYKLND